ncbi:hypothetical protein [Vibrio superstes]|nr:hypothetical protein [Vibrio superstes]
MNFLIAILAIYLANSCIHTSRFRSLIVFVTGIVGVTLHELSHYLIAKMLGFKVTQVCLFRMPTRANPTMGYVMFTRPDSMLGSVGHVLVSIAPLIIGGVCLYQGTQLTYVSSLIAQLQSASWSDYPETLYSIAIHSSLLDLASLFVLASITLYMLPSATDIRGALEGSLYIGLAVYLMIILGVTYTLSISDILFKYLEQLGTLMTIGVALSLPIATFALVTKK